MPRRCELGCSYNPGLTYHQFPHPEQNSEGFKAWVNIVGGKLEAAHDIKLYRKKVICDIHFANHFKNRNNRLNALAVPTLHLHGFSTQAVPVTIVIPPELSISEHIWNRPSTSKEVFSGFPTEAAHMPSIIPPELPTLEHIWNRPSTSKQIVTAVPAIAPIAAEHNYCSRNGRHQRQRSKGDKKKNEISAKSTSSRLENQLKMSRFQMKYLKSEFKRLRKRSETFKARLASADKICNKTNFEKITRNMTTAAKIFTKMQYTQTHKRARGRRFTLEEKVLTLSMYKRSPKSYALLYKYFTLPSAKSLKRLLAKVEIESGTSTAQVPLPNDVNTRQAPRQF